MRKKEFEVRGINLYPWDLPGFGPFNWTLNEWKNCIDIISSIGYNYISTYAISRLGPDKSTSYNVYYDKDPTTAKPETLGRVKLLQDVIKYAKLKGLRTRLLYPLNVGTYGFCSKHPELEAEPGALESFADTGLEGLVLCWNKPLVKEYLMDLFKFQVSVYSEVDGFEFIATDPGGCGCKKCKPYWKTVVDAIETYRKIIKSIKSDCEVVLITWHLTDDDIIKVTENTSKDIAVQIHCNFWEAKRSPESFAKLTETSVGNHHDTEAFMELSFEHYNPFPNGFPERIQQFLQILYEKGGRGASNFLPLGIRADMVNVYSFAKYALNAYDTTDVVLEYFSKTYGEKAGPLITEGFKLIEKYWKTGYIDTNYLNLSHQGGRISMCFFTIPRSRVPAWVIEKLENCVELAENAYEKFMSAKNLVDKEREKEAPLSLADLIIAAKVLILRAKVERSKIRAINYCLDEFDYGIREWKFMIKYLSEMCKTLEQSATYRVTLKKFNRFSKWLEEAKKCAYNPFQLPYYFIYQDYPWLEWLESP